MLYDRWGWRRPGHDSLANPNQTVSSWSTAYGTNLVKTYTLVAQTIPPSTNHVSFVVDMQIPIWEYDNNPSAGFSTNTDSLYLSGASTAGPPRTRTINFSGGAHLVQQYGDSGSYLNQSVIITLFIAHPWL